MEAFLWSIEFFVTFFSSVMTYVSQHRILSLFVLLSFVGLFIDALRGKSD